MIDDKSEPLGVTYNRVSCCFDFTNLSLLSLPSRRERFVLKVSSFPKPFSLSTMAANANANAENLNILANVATPNPLHDAHGCMGFAQATINFMIINQGMDSLAEFWILTNDEVELLCKVLCHPRGTTSNPPTPHPSFAVSIHT